MLLVFFLSKVYLKIFPHLSFSLTTIKLIILLFLRAEPWLAVPPAQHHAGSQPSLLPFPMNI